MTSLALKQAESKLQIEREKRQILEKEMANVPARFEEPQSSEIKAAKHDTEDSSGKYMLVWVKYKLYIFTLK